MCVQSILETLDVNKSVGIDEVHPYILRMCAQSISHQLSEFFMHSYCIGKLPQAWKDANVTPIYKKGSKSDPLYYRPVSLTSVPCKVMEKLIKNEMIRHLETNDLFTKHQHGFTRNRSCITNLLESMDILTHALDNGFLTVIILLDSYAKAFDTVPHEELILKLKAYGFSGHLLNWLIDFLSNRRQRVVQGESMSEWKKVESGVPQGSVLGPLLFLIFINDMPELVHHIVKLFADDSKLLAVIKQDSDMFFLQEDIDALVEWADEWRMRFNFKKCKAMHISNRSSPTDLHFPLRMNCLTTGKSHVLENSRSLGTRLRNPNSTQS